MRRNVPNWAREEAHGQLSALGDRVRGAEPCTFFRKRSSPRVFSFARGRYAVFTSPRGASQLFREGSGGGRTGAAPSSRFSEISLLHSRSAPAGCLDDWGRQPVNRLTLDIICRLRHPRIRGSHGSHSRTPRPHAPLSETHAIIVRHSALARSPNFGVFFTLRRRNGLPGAWSAWLPGSQRCR